MQSSKNKVIPLIELQLCTWLYTWSIFMITEDSTSLEHNSVPFLQPFTTGWTYARILSQATEYLERKKQHEEANRLLELLLSQKHYCTRSRGRWADRLALNYDHHLKKKDKVRLEMCLEVIFHMF